MTRRVAALLALVTGVIGVAACGDGEQECTVPSGVSPAWVRTIGCESDYALLWSERSDAVFSRTRTINWLIDREQDDRVYFIDTEDFTLHYFFATAYLNIEGLSPVGSHSEFNILNYRRTNRRFVLGKLIHYLDQGLLTIEMSAGDTADGEMIAGAYESIAESIFDGSRLRYRAVSADQEALLPELGERIATIATEEVFAGQSYQPLHSTVGYGTLRFRRIAELAGRPLGPTDIAVLDRVPTDLALVSGVITDEFQTPLSHVNILSKNRGTPNMAQRGAFLDASLRQYEDTLIRLEVSPQAFEIREATLAEASAFWDGLRPADPLIPALDSSVVGLVDLATVGHSAASSIGAKAANLAELARVSNPVPAPRSPFAVPFSAYENHLQSAGLDDDVALLLSDYADGDVGADELAARLFDIRWRIFRAPMDTALSTEITAAIEARFGVDTALRFRSSTNAEDLADFSGAGLYTSAGASLERGPRAVADAVKVVWASVWNLQAFVERDFYRVDHARVRMGVLVHEAFTAEEANGVAITINEFAQNRPAYYINSQVGEVSVTNPTGLATPEQILYYTWYEEPEYEIITRSSLLAGGPVLTEAQLANKLGAIHDHFRVILGGGVNFAMDVEFKLDSDKNLVIKQARPLKQR